MTYQALYRVWRSQRFDQIIGQQAITQTLKHAVAQKKTSHAYLFTGPRGTGKTSAAKIFAKAINCPHSVDGEPCNECEICQGITAGRLNDVLEIDAASNNGVEEIREIRDKVKYAPTQAEYKVYIIDEVHMLSTGAFNALLKTLEEPPQNVIFILATTEPHKIPLTIISRTQRFDFKRIRTKDSVAHMAEILKSMQIQYDEQALFSIARSAEGGMRDALSILDQVLSFSEGEVTLNETIQVTGSLTNDRMDQYLQACQRQEVEKALELLESLLDEGKEGSRLIEALLLHCRDLLMYQQAPQLLEERIGSVSEIFQKLAQELPASQIYLYIEILSQAQGDIRFTNRPNIYLEVATVKLATEYNNGVGMQETDTVKADQKTSEIEALQVKVQLLAQQIEELKKAGSAVVPLPVQEKNIPQQSSKKATNKSNYRVPTEQVYQVLKQATKKHLVDTKQVWSDILQMLSVTQRAMLKASDAVAASPTGLIVAFDYEIVCQRAHQDLELQEALRQNLNRLMQYEPTIVCIPADSWTALRKKYLSQMQENKSEMVASLAESNEEGVDLGFLPETNEEKAEDIVKQATTLFGEQVVEIIND